MVADLTPFTSAKKIKKDFKMKGLAWSEKRKGSFTKEPSCRARFLWLRRYSFWPSLNFGVRSFRFNPFWTFLNYLVRSSFALHIPHPLPVNIQYSAIFNPQFRIHSCLPLATEVLGKPKSKTLRWRVSSCGWGGPNGVHSLQRCPLQHCAGNWEYEGRRLGGFVVVTRQVLRTV